MRRPAGRPAMDSRSRLASLVPGAIRPAFRACLAKRRGQTPIRSESWRAGSVLASDPGGSPTGFWRLGDRSLASVPSPPVYSAVEAGRSTDSRSFRTVGGRFPTLEKKVTDTPRVPAFFPPAFLIQCRGVRMAACPNLSSGWPPACCPDSAVSGSHLIPRTSPTRQLLSWSS